MVHVHHSHAGKSLSSAARATMERSGEQWTAMRSAIFEALAGFDKPASAYDIADQVSKSQGRRVAANSVYRILDLFGGARCRPADRLRAATAGDRSPRPLRRLRTELKGSTGRRRPVKSGGRKGPSE